MDKKNPIPYTSWLAVIIIGAIVVNFVTGIGDAMNELWMQLGRCERSDAGCFLLYDGSVIVILFIITLIIDFVRRRKNSEQKENQSFPTEKQINADQTSKPERSVEPPAIVKRFSSNLDKIKKERIKAGWEITGISLGFLDKIKTAPPFLGLHHDKPIISLLDEQTLTEFFLASIYIEKYRNVIKGGRYIVRDGDNRQIIAKNKYGDERYEVYVPERHTYPNGMIFDLPYINLATPDHHEFVERKIEVSKDIERMKSLLQQAYHLVRDEAIPVLRMIYDAAQKTRSEEQEKAEIISAEKHVYPTHAKGGPQEVGVTLYNGGKQKLADVYIKLVKITNKGFNDELGGFEYIPIDIRADNRLFESSENSIQPKDKTTFILAKVQGEEVILLLKKRPHSLKRYHKHVNPQNFHSHEQWDIEFDVYGEMSGKHFRERFLTVMSSSKIESFSDSTLDDSLTLDIKGEIIHVYKEETDEEKDDS